MTNSTSEPWITDKEWTEQYYPAIRNVVYQLAKDIINIEIAPDQQDRENATDYIISIPSGQIACRIRRPNCGFRDITLRSWRISGIKTELEKIREGFARWYLYAWAKDRATFESWIFLDLDKLRTSGLLEKTRTVIFNNDKSSGFITLTITELLENHCVFRLEGELVHKILEEEGFCFE